MAVSTRLKGNGGLFFSLKRGSSSAVVFDDVKSWNVTYEDKDAGDVTFSEAQAGIGKNVVLTITGITSFDASSLYKYVWDNVGASDIAVTIGPKGNATPSAAQPHFKFTASNNSKPELGNEANADPNGAGAEFEFTLNGTTDIVWTTA